MHTVSGRERAEHISKANLRTCHTVSGSTAFRDVEGHRWWFNASLG